MNKNFVSQQEYKLQEGISIVSRTDLKGNITEANEAFIEASGYDWNELVGKPHNILRHPDVPAAVFKDFWRTIQNGKPWSQIVKNRRKNGDHYWVIANATPIFENGKITGYMSVRTPVSRNQINSAELAYKAISQGKLELREGYPNTLKNRINPFKNLEPSLLIAVFSVALLASITVSMFTTNVPKFLFEITDILLILGILTTSITTTSKMKAIYEHLTEISSGRFNNEIDARGNNLLSRILGRLKSMQIRLGADFDDVKAALNNAKRIESALNAASSNIMVADKFRSIIFMNESIQKMLKEAEPELKKDLPHFEADNLIRQSIDIFHKHPEHQVNLLEGLSSTFNTRIKVGNATMDLIVDPIYNELDERIGTVAEWKNVTDQLLIEENISQIVSNASEGLLNDRIQTEALEGFNKDLSLYVNTLLDSFSTLINNISKILCQMSNGDLTQRMEGDYKGEVHAMKVAINNALSNIEGTFGQVKVGSSEIGTMSSEVSVASEDLSERTQSQAASLEETAASMEQITAIVQSSTENTYRANDLSSQAEVEAKSGIEVMNQTSKAMHGISELSKQIAEITSVIDGIAFQTNLLALNAAVEAARAGEHGKGFAVVAGEVRNLAQKSAESSKEISKLITSATQQINKGTALVENTNAVFEQMVEKTNEVSKLLQAVATTVDEQTKGLKQINIAVSNLDQMTQQNAALVEELAATSGNMSEQAQLQSQFVGKFKISKTPALNTNSNSRIEFELEEAKNNHLAWNVQLERLLLGRNVDFDNSTARQDHACQLGQWIYGEGQKYNHLTEMQKLIETHSEMHKVIGYVIDAVSVDDPVLAQQHKVKANELSGQIESWIDQLKAKLNESHTQSSSLNKKTRLTKQASSNEQPRITQKSENWNEF